MQIIKLLHGFAFIALISQTTTAQLNSELNAANKESAYNPTPVSSKKQLNFFIISKRKKGKLDLATRYNTFRSKIKSFFYNKKFVAIVAGDAAKMSRKVQHRLKKYDARIGTLWFDSHGSYAKGYSLFNIGQEEFSYKNLKDSNATKMLKELAAYADTRTTIIVGSCYGGATYSRSSVDYKDTTRMNGDSLLIGLGNIFKQAIIYGSESWVMTKPGLFLKKYSVTGYPRRHLFRDLCYRPAWENIGKWNEYNAVTGAFNFNTVVRLDRLGNIRARSIAYNEKKRVQKKIRKNINRLEPWAYK